MPSMFKIEQRGFRELKKTFQDAPRKVKNIGRQWTKEVGADELKYLQAEWDKSAKPQTSKRTGRFKKTIETFTRDWVIYLRVRPYPKLGMRLYKWIIGGTRPHWIAARKAKALHFFWIRKRKWVFFKRVHHPGTKPNDFVTRGAAKFQPRVRYWLEILGDRIVQVLGK